MFIGDLIGAEQACEILQISRPTLKKYRERYRINHFKIKKNIYYSKLEILYKVYAQIFPLTGKIDFGILNIETQLESLKIGNDIYDLRKIDSIDGHGVISLICHLMTEINNGKFIHLLIDHSNKFLKAMNFFGVLRMHLNSKVFWNDDIFNAIEQINYDNIIKLPVTRLGVVGAHLAIADDLVLSLSRQGYSRDICSYIGWAFGELADNATTHAKVHPCFVYFEQFGKEKTYLQFTIGDIGIGIPNSLRENERYSNLNDAKALLTSFKPNVSGRADSEGRGKGLTDVLKIAMECGSQLRVESNDNGFLLIFNSGNDNFLHVRPLFHASGTIISILFVDQSFASLEREDVSKYIDKCLERV